MQQTLALVKKISSSLSDLSDKSLILFRFGFLELHENRNDFKMLAIRSTSSPTGC
jgi:hypothetical protein